MSEVCLQKTNPVIAQLFFIHVDGEQVHVMLKP